MLVISSPFSILRLNHSCGLGEKKPIILNLSVRVASELQIYKQSCDPGVNNSLQQYSSTQNLLLTLLGTSSNWCALVRTVSY